MSVAKLEISFSCVKFFAPVLVLPGRKLEKVQAGEISIAHMAVKKFSSEDRLMANISGRNSVADGKESLNDQILGMIYVCTLLGWPGNTV